MDGYDIGVYQFAGSLRLRKKLLLGLESLITALVVAMHGFNGDISVNQGITSEKYLTHSPASGIVIATVASPVKVLFISAGFARSTTVPI